MSASPIAKYEPASFYQRLAKQEYEDTRNWHPPSWGSGQYSAEPVLGYKGQDIDTKCPVNQSYHSIPPGTDFKRHLIGPTSNTRELYPTRRLADGQYFYKNMERLEPTLNGKGFMYDATFDETNPVPGLNRFGYRSKIYPLTDEYPREIYRYNKGVLPYPNY